MAPQGGENCTTVAGQMKALIVFLNESMMKFITNASTWPSNNKPICLKSSMID